MGKMFTVRCEGEFNCTFSFTKTFLFSRAYSLSWKCVHLCILRQKQLQRGKYTLCKRCFKTIYELGPLITSGDSRNSYLQFMKWGLEAVISGSQLGKRHWALQNLFSFSFISLGVSIDLTVEARLSRCLSSLSLGFDTCQPSDPSKTYLALVWQFGLSRLFPSLFILSFFFQAPWDRQRRLLLVQITLLQILQLVGPNLQLKHLKRFPSQFRFLLARLKWPCLAIYSTAQHDAWHGTTAKDTHGSGRINRHFIHEQGLFS